MKQFNQSSNIDSFLLENDQISKMISFFTRNNVSKQIDNLSYTILIPTDKQLSDFADSIGFSVEQLMNTQIFNDIVSNHFFEFNDFDIGEHEALNGNIFSINYLDLIGKTNIHEFYIGSNLLITDNQIKELKSINLNVIIFKVQKLTSNVYRKGQKYSIDNLTKLNWNSSDSYSLTDTLNKQCIISQIQYSFMDTFCMYPKYYEYGNYLPSLFDDNQYKGYPINDEKLLCKWFLSNSSGYDDVFYRNEKVLSYPKSKDSVDIHAVVLLDNNFYVGHVYCWLSMDKTIVFMMGIQSNIINILLKNSAV